MQELFSESDMDSGPKIRGSTTVTGLVDAYQLYYLEYYGAYPKCETDPFRYAVTHCTKNSIRPVDLVHSVFIAATGDVVKPYHFKDARCARAYESWLGRMPDELAGVELATPKSVETHIELQTVAHMILTKYGKLDFNHIKFKIACADPMFDVTPCARMILSDVHPVIMEYYGEEYLDWMSKNPWREKIMADFGFDHQQIKDQILHGNSRKSSTNN